MNPHDSTTTSVTSSVPTTGNIPGVARIESLPPFSEPNARVPRLLANTLMADFVAGLLGKVGRILSPALVVRSLQAAKKVGHFAVLVGGALTLAYAIFDAIKQNSFSVFAVGLGLVVALAVAQFAAVRFLNAADTIVSNTPSRVSSSAFLECAGLLILLLAATILLGGIAGAISARNVMPLIPALFFGLTLTCFGAIALHPQVVNVELGAGSAGEEAIGLLSFFFKAGLKLVPLFFLVLSAGGALALLVSFFGTSGGLAIMADGLANSFRLPVQIPNGLSGSALVLVGCLIPILGYFLFLLEYLFVDVLRAVLSVPAKLDVLRR
jgi:hypothetical protein